MSSLSSQFSLPAPPTFETQLAAFQDLSQLLSEDFDRAKEASYQFIQKTNEANWQAWLNICSVSEPQDWFMTSTARTQSWFEQSQVYQQTLINIAQNFSQKAQQLVHQASNFPLSQYSLSTPDFSTIFIQASPVLYSVKLDESPKIENRTLKTRSAEATTVKAKPLPIKKIGKTATPTKTRARNSTETKIEKAPSTKRKAAGTAPTANEATTLSAKPSFPTVPGRDGKNKSLNQANKRLKNGA